MLGFVEIVPIYFLFKFNILYQGKERPAKTKLMPAKLIFQFRAVLTSAESDSVQCKPALSHIFREYLCKNKFFSKTILAC